MQYVPTTQIAIVMGELCHERRDMRVTHGVPDSHDRETSFATCPPRITKLILSLECPCPAGHRGLPSLRCSSHCTTRLCRPPPTSMPPRSDWRVLPCARHW